MPEDRSRILACCRSLRKLCSAACKHLDVWLTGDLTRKVPIRVQRNRSSLPGQGLLIDSLRHGSNGAPGSPTRAERPGMCSYSVISTTVRRASGLFRKPDTDFHEL